MTALIDSEYESTCAPGLAELNECSSRKALWLELWQCQSSHDRSLSEAPGRMADSADSMDLANWSQSQAYVTDDEWDWSIQHGNGYLAEGVVLTCGVQFAHAQQPHIPRYWANS